MPQISHIRNGPCFGLIGVAAKALGCAHIVKLIMSKRYFMNSQTPPKKQNFNFQVFREMIVVADTIVMNFNVSRVRDG